MNIVPTNSINSPMTSGLQQNELQTELNNYIGKLGSQNRWSSITAGVASFVGLTAIDESSVLSMASWTSTDSTQLNYDKSTNSYYNYTTTNWYLDNTYSEIIVAVGNALIPVWVLVGFGIYKLGRKYFANYQVPPIVKVGFQNRYEASGLIDGEDIESFMQIINSKNVRKSLIEKMNFEQLYFAKQVLSPEEFSAYIGPVKKEPHRQWCSIISLTQKVKTLEKLVKQLKNRTIRQITAENPLFGTALYEEWERVYQIKPVIDSTLFFSMDLNNRNEQAPIQQVTEDEELLSAPRGNKGKPPLRPTVNSGKDEVEDGKEEEIELEVVVENSFPSPTNNPINGQEMDTVIIEVEDEEPIIVKKSVLCANSEYFHSLLEGNMQESRQNKIKIRDVQDFETFKIFIKIITGQPILFNANDSEKLIKLLDKYHSKKALEALDRYIATHQHLFSTENLYELALEGHPSLDSLRFCLETKSLGKKLSDENWKKYWKQACDLQFAELRKKCIAFARLELEEAINSNYLQLKRVKSWFKRCYTSLSPDEYRALTQTLANQLKVENFRPIFTGAASIEDLELIDECVKFCKNHITEIKDYAPWEVYDTPEAISEVLYP